MLLEVIGSLGPARRCISTSLGGTSLASWLPFGAGRGTANSTPSGLNKYGFSPMHQGSQAQTEENHHTEAQ